MLAIFAFFFLLAGLWSELADSTILWWEQLGGCKQATANTETGFNERIRPGGGSERFGQQLVV
jgi:hypothetical protein